jgi:hypothetical protein
VADIVANLPISYYNPEIDADGWHEYKAAKIDEIEKEVGSLTTGDYSIPPTAAELVCNVLKTTKFGSADDEALYRQRAIDSGKVRPEDTYDNRFVKWAMQNIK